MKIKNIFKQKKIIIGVLIAAFLGFNSFKLYDDDDDFELIKNLEIYHTLMRDLRIMYVDEISSGDLIKNSIDKMLENLDPYTVYYPESLIEDVRFANSGEYAGIGTEIDKIDNFYEITNLIKNSPAEKNGLLIGDKIISINDKLLNNKSIDEVDLLLKGENGSNIKFEIQRNNNKLNFSFKREIIKEKSIPYYGTINNNIGYIKLSSFTQNCSNELKEAFISLKEKQNINQLILDLRNNPGGLLIEAVNIVNLFIEKGENVVEMKGRVEQWNKMFKAENNPIDTKIPIIVLVNGQSASASEIVSGALQDLDRAVVIGEQTFGKGLVQTTKDLVYNAKCKITTAKYYIPSGRCIQKLDYSHKNSEGKAISIPDSLIKTFKTKNGRTVKDAGGILPDIIINSDTLSYFVENLIYNKSIYNFSNQYRNKNNQISEPEKFSISQQDLNDFKTQVGKKMVDYNTSTEKQIKEIENLANIEFENNELNQEFNKIKQKIQQIKESNINKYDDQLKKLLEYEIVKRYYYEEGEIRYSLKNDKNIDKAIEVLNNEILYKKILLNK
ncbi:MAG: S41 family peptidase [Bacteroidales bacterium]|nr:S41 family peptidase [Bacteroidales bacterium]